MVRTGTTEPGTAINSPVMSMRAAAFRLAQRVRVDLLLIVLDASFVTLALAASLLLRFDGRVPGDYWRSGFVDFLPAYLATVLLANLICGMYGQVWRHASVPEARRVLMSAGLAGVVLFVLDGVERRALPWSALVLSVLMQAGLSGGVRFYSRLFSSSHRLPPPAESGRRVVVVGAGEAAAALVRDMQRSAHWASRPLRPVAMLDDNVRLHGHACLGVPVVGPISSLPEVVASKHAEQVVLAIPSARQEVVQRVAALADQAHTTLRVLPGVAQLVHQRVSVSDIRELRIDDLIGRRQIATDLEAVRAALQGRRVLITGAGGSIGSEIVRQVARCDPAELIALDHDETHLHDLVSSMTEPVTQLLADVRDSSVVDAVFAQLRPEVVFHAAAHKHVPVLENYPCEAARTNILGTENVVTAAHRVGVERFVYISTDKAVRPASVMGASKRLGEQIALTDAPLGRYCAVRFGNVLGSRGSVVPTFLKQIECGGPVTVTDTRMTRFFMSIPEAVQLVLQAAIFADGGEVFMLDMGEPVRILDLAQRMIQLAGGSGREDVRIEVVGIRPGEKLEEELHTPEELTTPTPHPSIVKLTPIRLGSTNLHAALNELRLAAHRLDDQLVRTIIFDTVGAIAGRERTSADDEVGAFAKFAPPISSQTVA